MTTPIAEATPPKCPHCKEDMPTIDGYAYTLGLFTILSVSCTKCKALLHMGIMPPRMYSETAPEEPPSPLWKPQ